MHRGAEVTEHRGLTTCENRSDPPPFSPQSAVPHCVHASVDPSKSPRPGPMLHSAVAQAQPPQLRRRHDPKLPRSHRLRASLKLTNYDPKRDFVGWGAEDR